MRTLQAAFAIAVVTGCTSYSATIVNSSDAGTTGGNPASTSNPGNSVPTAGASASGGAGTTAGGGASTPGGTPNGSAPTGGGAGAPGGTSAALATSSAGAVNAGGTPGIGGVANLGGANAGIGGASTGGLAPALGGAPLASGGANASGSAGTLAGGNASVGGGVAPGGSSPTTGGAAPGGSSSTTGGASACTKDADCINADPINCSYTCVNPGASGTCKPTLLTTNTRCATPDCADRAISGFWDASGKPYIAYGFTETDGSASIRMQALKLDGTADGEAVGYAIPIDEHEPYQLSTNVLGGEVGLLWSTLATTTGPSPDLVVEFTKTNLAGAKSTLTEVERDSYTANRGILGLWLQTTSAQAWLGIEEWQAGSAADGFAATTGSIGAWSTLSPPVYSGRGFAILTNTLMLVGSHCNACGGPFELQRYSANNLSSIGSFITLSQSKIRYSALGTVGAAMAALWTEVDSPGQVFRALVREDGSFPLPASAVQSAIQPKVVFPSADGGAILIGTILTMSLSTPTYQLMGQRLDSALNLVGSPLPLADAQTADAESFESRLSSDGMRALLTYHQVGARYRLLSTSYCW